MSDILANADLPYGRQWVDEEDVRGVAAAAAATFLTTGPGVEAFEAELCRVTGAGYAVVCANGTAALHLACMALGVESGDLGLTSPISFLASANCIEFCKGRTDFIDIDPSSLCLSVEDLEAYCRTNETPSLVIPVDFAGLAADLPAIKQLADKYGFKVIEDAAHSLGSSYRFEGESYACGSCAHTDLAIFSFHPVKTITTGEGGAVMTNDRRLAQRLRRLRSHGMKSGGGEGSDGPWYYEMAELGYNYRITDLQCALGLTQLNKLSSFRARRQEIVSFYNEGFGDNDGLIRPPAGLAEYACPHLYPIQFKGGAKIRRAMYGRLKENGIHCQVHYIPIYLQPYYAGRYGYEKGKCRQAETYYSQCLSLPLFPAMSNKDVQRVIGAVIRELDAK